MRADIPPATAAKKLAAKTTNRKIGIQVAIASAAGEVAESAPREVPGNAPAGVEREDRLHEEPDCDADGVA